MDDDVRIISAKLSEIAGALDHFNLLLSPEEADRVRSLCISEKRRLYTLSHGILHIILGRFLNITPDSVLIQYDRAGLPFAAGRTDRVRFNISHSGDYALYSVSRVQSSGVDVQHWKAVRDRLRFASRYFTTEENRLLLSTEPVRRLSLFYRIWCRKEACTKALSMGREIPFDSFDVRPGVPSPEISITGPEGKSFLIKTADLSLMQGYSASAAAVISGTAPRFILETFTP